MPPLRRQGMSRRANLDHPGIRAILVGGGWWEWWGIDSIHGPQHVTDANDEGGRLLSRPFLMWRYRDNPQILPADLDDTLREAWPELRDELQAENPGRVLWGAGRYDGKS